MPALPCRRGTAALGRVSAASTMSRPGHAKVHVALPAGKEVPTMTRKVLVDQHTNESSPTHHSMPYLRCTHSNSITDSRSPQTTPSNDSSALLETQRIPMDHTSCVPSQLHIQSDASQATTAKYRGRLPTTTEKSTYRFDDSRIPLTTAPSLRDTLVIEGVSTGEEVFVSGTLPRRSNAAVDDANRAGTDVRLLKRRLATVQGELTSSTNKMTSLQKKCDRLRESGACALDECRQRLRLIVASSDARETAMREIIAYLQCECIRISAEHSKVVDQLARTRDEVGEMQNLTKTNQDLADQLAQREVEKSRLRSEYDQLRQEADRLRRKIEDMTLQFSYDKKGLEIKTVETQEKLLRAQRELEERNIKMHDRDQLYTHCKVFIESICQPNFRVVKDATLEPVKRSDNRSDGFALIPLSVLLQGYLILPIDERTALIRHYEQKLDEATTEAKTTAS